MCGKCGKLYKISSIKSKVFKKLCEDMRTEHLSLLYYSSARWHSRGNVLSRTFELRQEIFIFPKEKGYKDAEYFADVDFLIKLAYLCDIFEKLNSLNVLLQGENAPSEVNGKNISFYKKKLKLWGRKCNEDTGKDCLLILQQILTSNELDLSQDIKTMFEGCLSQLIIWFEKYFQN
jgi:hypothetical protein